MSLPQRPSEDYSLHTVYDSSRGRMVAGGCLDNPGSFSIHWYSQYDANHYHHLMYSLEKPLISPLLIYFSPSYVYFLYQQIRNSRAVKIKENWIKKLSLDSSVSATSGWAPIPAFPRCVITSCGFTCRSIQRRHSTAVIWYTRLRDSFSNICSTSKTMC